MHSACAKSSGDKTFDEHRLDESKRSMTISYKQERVWPGVGIHQLTIDTPVHARLDSQHIFTLPLNLHLEYGIPVGLSRMLRKVFDN